MRNPSPSISIPCGALLRRALLLVVVASALLVSCGSPTRTAADGLTLWMSNNPPEIATGQWSVEKWQADATRPPVQMQPVPEGQSSEEVILAAVVGGTTPDIYANMWQGSVAMYAEAGVLVALDTLAGFSDWLSRRCSVQTIAEVTAPDGHIYQVPWKVNPIVTMYNTAMFAEGLPQTYDDYLAAGARLHVDNSGDGYVDQYVGYTSPRTIWYERLFNFYPLYLAATDGAPLVENGTPVFDRPEAVAVFAFLRKLYAKDYFTRDQLASSGDPFLGSKVASQWTGPWSVDYMQRQAPKDFSYAFGPMLVPTQVQPTVVRPTVVQPTLAKPLRGEADHKRSEAPIPRGKADPKRREAPIFKGEADPSRLRRPYTYGDPKNIVLFNTVPDAQQAWDFLAETLLSDEGDLQLLTASGQLPRRQDLLSNSLFGPYFQSNPDMVPFAEQAERIRGVNTEPRIVEVLDIISQEYEACVLYGVKTPEQAIHDASEAVTVLLNP